MHVWLSSPDTYTLTVKFTQSYGYTPNTKCCSINGIICVTVGVARERTLTAQWPWVPSIGQNLQPFTGHGDVSMWLKNSWLGQKSPSKQTNNNANSLLVWNSLQFALIQILYVSLHWYENLSWYNRQPGHSTRKGK